MFILLPLVLPFYYYYGYFKFSNYQVQNLKQLATIIKKTSEENLNATLEKVAYKNELCIEYYDGLNNIQYNTLKVGCALGKNNQGILNIEKEFINSNESMTSYNLLNDEYETRAYLYGIKLNSGYVFLYNTLEDLSVSNRILRNQLIYLTIIAIIFACFIAYFLSQKLTCPFRYH